MWPESSKKGANDMTAFYEALHSLGVEEREETEKVLQVVENGKRRERAATEDDIEMFTRLVQPGRVVKLYDADHPTKFETEQEPPEDEYPCMNAMLWGFLIGIISTLAVVALCFMP
jgi:hypothetical protein